MFPDSNHSPTRRVKSRISVLIAETIGLDFLAPEVGVCGRPGGVLWTPVPKAAIDEDDHSCGAEHYVGPPSAITKHRTVDPKAETPPVQEPAECDFRPSVPASGPSHPVADTAR
jgi:hypothetical protein